MFWRGAVWSGMVAISLALGPADLVADEATDFFETRIRPVLVAQCFECHSAAADEIQGGLRLDSRDAMRGGGDSGPAVVPGEPEESLILDALRHEGLEMPPGKRLPATVVANFERWIREGAVDPRDGAGGGPLADEIQRAAHHHWAFQPVADPEPPQVPSPAAAQTALDRFIIARLRSAGLSLSPPADRPTLIRRAYFDLLGLPPTPEEVEAFVGDPAPEAFARLVDRLLENPHYGERWGRYWLDLARYADNKGYVFFEENRYPWAWTYRDYVIESFNNDLPYDRFLLEQLAADQLDLGDDRRPLRALGFLTVGARFMNNIHDILDDRIDVVTRGLLGLTVSCARCHDHKYDPVSQEDYYGLYGVFRSSPEPILPPEFEPAEDTEADRAFRAGMRERMEKLEAFIAEQRTEIIEGARRRAAEYLMAVHRKRNQPDTENFMLLTDKGGLNPAMIHRWETYLAQARRDKDPVWHVWHAFSDLPDETFKTQAREVHERLFAGANGGELAINPRVREAFADQPPADMGDVAERYGRLLAAVRAEWETAQKEHSEAKPGAEVSATDAGLSAPTALDDEASEALRQVLYAANSPPMIPRELSWGFLDLLPDRPTQNEFKKLLKEVETWSMNQPGAPPRAMVLRDAETPYDPVVFLRGNPNRHGPRVSRHYPRFFSAPATTSASSASPALSAEPFNQGSGRRELAERIVAPDNPLTARVLVNRVWMHHFRRGLVETPSDFGLRSDPPSHPELLDWLATRFQQHGWSLKELHRLIMNSAVYQQAGRRGDEHERLARRVDPENRLLWCYPRRRLDFEALRDSLLAVSGALDPTLGGPPRSLLDGFHPRRTIYGFVDRMNLPGLMRSFDFPDPAASAASRPRTTVPPQALFFLNHEFLTQCASRLLGRPDVLACGSPGEKIERIYRIVYSRPPGERELEWATAFLEGREPEEPQSPWSYGYGRVDEETQHVTGFSPLTYWTGRRWQAGPQLPDPKLGWVFLDRKGGHPAATPDRCAIRRWTAPRTGRYRVSGTLRHAPQAGNGVRGRLVSSRQGVLGQWKVHHSEAETVVEEIALQAGDTLDLVVDFQGEILHDEHEWTVVIRAAGGEKDEVEEAAWDSEADFRGAAADPWLDYVHALLMTNEFVFVD